MGSIVVGYVPKAEGKAALSRAVEEAKLRNAQAGRRQLQPRRPGARAKARRSEIEQQLDQVRDELKELRAWSTRCASSCAGSSRPRT